jgi:hypothetical protein
VIEIDARHISSRRHQVVHQGARQDLAIIGVDDALERAVQLCEGRQQDEAPGAARPVA